MKSSQFKNTERTECQKCIASVGTVSSGWRVSNFWALRRGFTVLELLVTFGIISTLAGLILPAIGSVREAARKMQCTSQLKQIGLALHNYHQANNSLPPGLQWESTQKSAYGWAVPLLPYLEQRPLYSQVNRNLLIEHPSNQVARNTLVPLFLCPSDITEQTFILFEETKLIGTSTSLVELPTANYLGVFGTFEPDDQIPAPKGDGTFCGSQSTSFAQLTRGLSNTIIVGERKMATVPSTWLGVSYLGEDAACRLVGSVMKSPNCKQCDECEFSSRHSGGSNFLWADGHVSLVSESIDTKTYQQMSRR